MGNPVVHWELMSKEPEKVAGGNGGVNGGIVKPDQPGPWYREKVAAGGKIHVEEHKVPGMGKFSLFTDPEGRMMGLWKAKGQ